MRWLLFLLMTGCTAGFIAKESPQMVSCHAAYISWFNDKTLFDATVCDAGVKVGKTETQQIPWTELLKARGFGK